MRWVACSISASTAESEAICQGQDGQSRITGMVSRRPIRSSSYIRFSSSGDGCAEPARDRSPGGLVSYSWCGPWWSPGPGRHCGDTQSGPDGHPRGGGATSVVVGGPADRVLVTGLGPTARAPAVGLVAVFVDDPGVRDLTHVFSFFADGVDRGGPRRPHQPVLVGTGTPGVHAGAVSWSRSRAGAGS